MKKKKPVVDSVVILDGNATEIRRHLSEVRPDLSVYDQSVEKRFLQGRKYAIITFDPGEIINEFSDVSWIHCSGAGVDYLLDSLRQPVPLITRTVGNMGQQIAEYVLAYALFFNQKIASRSELQKARSWDRSGASPQYLAGSRALIFGTGAIGCAVADTLGGFSVRCDGVSRSGKQKAPFEFVKPVASLGSMAMDAYNLVVLALPRHPDTQSLIDSRVLERMDAAMLINVGRAQVLVIEDLLCAISHGHVGQAVLDVFEPEPLAETSNLWLHPKVWVTPHVSGLTQPADTASAFVSALDRQEAGLEPALSVSQQRGY